MTKAALPILAGVGSIFLCPDSGINVGLRDFWCVHIRWCMSGMYEHHFGRYLKMYCKKLVTRVKSHASTFRVENSAIKKTIKKKKQWGIKPVLVLRLVFWSHSIAIVPSELAVSPLTFFGFVVVLSRLWTQTRPRHGAWMTTASLTPEATWDGGPGTTIPGVGPLLACHVRHPFFFYPFP